jgi:enamine deaminase RidA (YjgF/YER057c/UK114 family)
MTFSIAASAGDRKFIVNPRADDRKGLPFSEGVLVGNTLYIAGHIGLDPKTGLAPADAGAEAHLVMDGIKKTVQEAGLSMDDVVSMQIFCTDLKLYDTFQCRIQDLFPWRFSGTGIHRGRQAASQRPVRGAGNRGETITVTSSKDDRSIGIPVSPSPNPFTCLNLPFTRKILQSAGRSCAKSPQRLRLKCD